MKDGETVYKMMGKVMVRQDPAEAKSNVTQRLRFIEAELYGQRARQRAQPGSPYHLLQRCARRTKAEDAIKAAQEKIMASRKRVAAMQEAYAAAMSAGASAGGAGTTA